MAKKERLLETSHSCGLSTKDVGSDGWTADLGGVGRWVGEYVKSLHAMGRYCTYAGVPCRITSVKAHFDQQVI